MNRQHFSELLATERCKRKWRTLTFEQREKYRKLYEEKNTATKANELGVAKERQQDICAFWDAFNFPRMTPLHVYLLDDQLKTREQLEVYREPNNHDAQDWNAFIAGL
jgi:hypothetical protein